MLKKLIVLVAILFIFPQAIQMQSKPTQNECGRVVREDFARWERDFMDVAERFMEGMTSIPRVLRVLSDGRDYALSPCDFVRAEYLRYTTVMYASLLNGFVADYTYNPEAYDIYRYSGEIMEMLDFQPNSPDV
jgi:hypothetical protein